MLYLIIKKDDLSLHGQYERENNDGIEIESELYLTLELPENLDANCVKAILIDNVITLVEDTDKVAAKIAANKSSRISELNTQTWTTILTQAQIVYSDITINVLDWNSSSVLILASHSTYQDMVDHPAAYVGDIFADQAAVLAYAEPKLAASSAFGKWRLGVLASEAVQVAAIEAE